MEAAESKIKEELTHWIQTLNDAHLLHLLNSIKLSESNTKVDWWDELTEHQRENIQLGIKDLNEGRTISSQEFWSELRSDD
tara:strand:- start:844 stop:1086 length:243 start_codon:yes stop_codon:yes gene_type:complete